jgi:hypothetical protein
MKPVRTHHPGPPADAEPPERLTQIAEHLRDPLIVRSGVTTTTDGRWALYVTVPENATVPISGVEQQAEGFPVVYEVEPREPPRAGPAYPGAKRRST